MKNIKKHYVYTQKQTKKRKCKTMKGKHFGFEAILNRISLTQAKKISIMPMP